MADNEAVDISITNGVNQDSSGFDDLAAKSPKKAEVDAGNGDADHLKVRIEELERENRDLSRENAEMKAALEKTVEEKEAVGKLLGEVKAAEAERSESIKKRAVELEGQVVRLQEDLIAAVNTGDEAGREVERLRQEVEALRTEKSALSEKVDAQAGEFERSRSDYESKISELVKKTEGLEDRTSETNRETAKADEQAEARLGEMERELNQLKKEKTEVDDAMRALESELKRSEEKLAELSKKANESEELISGMVEKASQRGIDGIAEAGEEKGGFSGLKKGIQFPVAGALSASAVAATLAVCYVRYGKTR